MESESPRRYGNAKLLVILSAYGLGVAVATFFTLQSPLGVVLFTKFGTPPDQATIRRFMSEDHEVQLIEEHIQQHPLTAHLRMNKSLAESRPHLQLPLQFRSHNLTAGTLLGPGRLVVPPVMWTDTGKSLISISYLGPDLCGHPGIIHGGILATMLDEGMARCCWDALPLKTAVTANLEINYRKPVLAKNYIVLRAETLRVEGRKAWVKGRIETLAKPGEEPQLLAEASGLFISPRPTSPVSFY